MKSTCFSHNGQLMAEDHGGSRGNTPVSATCIPADDLLVSESHKEENRPGGSVCFSQDGPLVTEDHGGGGIYQSVLDGEEEITS